MSGLFVQVHADTAPVLFWERFTAGRTGAGLDLSLDEYVSTRDAGFAPAGDGWTVEDPGSTNGTWLNGQRVYGPHPLARGDKIRIGHTVLTVVPVD
jgi:hypothetical protein